MRPWIWKAFGTWGRHGGSVIGEARRCDVARTGRVSLSRTGLATPKYADARMRGEMNSNGADGFLRRPTTRPAVPSWRSTGLSVSDQLRVSEIEAPLKPFSARITTDCLLPRVVSERCAVKPGAAAVT